MSTKLITRRRLISLTGATATAALAGCIGGEADEPGSTNGHGQEEHSGVEGEYEAYVLAYHWGYAVFDDHGSELDIVEVAQNTEVTLHAVNDHAYDAFEKLPEEVAAQFEEFDARARTKAHVEAGEIPEPEEATIGELYDEAHGGDHGHDDDGHGHDDDGHGHDDDGHGHDDDGHGHDDDGHGHDDDGHGHDDDGHGHDDDGHGHDDDGHGYGDHEHAGGKLDHGFMIPEFDVVVDVPADANEPTTVSFLTAEPGTFEAMCTVDCGYGHAFQQRELIRVTENA